MASGLPGRLALWMSSSCCSIASSLLPSRIFMTWYSCDAQHALSRRLYALTLTLTVNLNLTLNLTRP